MWWSVVLPTPPDIPEAISSFLGLTLLLGRFRVHLREGRSHDLSNLALVFDLVRGGLGLGDDLHAESRGGG
mgnify:CR=1 FL=1